ncbi:MAG: fructose-2,6-bisphosphatase [Bryobacterales bacterium]|nr:fructose-2,6-bisphosphatase [Bryobacterales bacterium]
MKFCIGAFSVLLLAGPSYAQQLQGDALVKALRQGGYVIVMRHASSPREVPDKTAANPDNVKPERQLDQEGRASATAMGKALRDLKIPIGTVLTSPTYRALETIRYAQFSNPQAFPELGDNGQSMQGGTEAQAAWLQKKVTEFPKGTDTLIVTHMPNMSRAFPQSTSNLADGEALIFGPSGVVARIKIEEWKGMLK